MTNAAGRTTAVGSLVAIALVWGVAFSIVKGALHDVSPATVVTWRFTVAAAVLLVVRPRCLCALPVHTWRRGLILGVILGIAFLVHTQGMQSTSVMVAAFLTGTVVVFAPVVARIYPGRRITPVAGFSITLATAGMAVITLRNVSIGNGELLLTAAALLWAVHLVGLEIWTDRGDFYALAVIQLVVASVLAAAVQLWTAGTVPVPASLTTMGALIGLGALATGGAFLLLTWAQTRIDATTAAVILTLEPVFGAVTAVALGEPVILRVAAGAMLILVGATIAASPNGRAGRSLRHATARRALLLPANGPHLRLAGLQQVRRDPRRAAPAP